MRRNSIIVVILALLAVAFVMPRLGGTAPRPGIFDAGLTLAAARERSAAEDKPVMAFLTADWCGPCQAFKRGALSDPAVEALVRERFIPVYIDVDRAPDDARAFADVEGIPTTIVWNDGREIDRTVGVMPPGAFRSWLETAVATEADDEPRP